MTRTNRFPQSTPRNNKKHRHINGFLGCLGAIIMLTLGSCLGVMVGVVRGLLIGQNMGEPLEIYANAGVAHWIEAAANEYNDTHPARPIKVTVIEAGNAVVSLTKYIAQPTMWIPDNELWVNLAAEKGANNFSADCQNVANSPLVLGMWEKLASSLGYPGRNLGWLDMAGLAADQSAWDYYSHGGMFGDKLRIGHTHPGISGSGASTLLAVVQSAEGNLDPSTTQQNNNPIVEASLSAFEGGVSWFSRDTALLGETMIERGPSFLGVGVMYENTLLEANQKAKNDERLLPIYPFEGTFMATHPACVNNQRMDEEQAGARAFRDYLLSEAGQKLAVEFFGLRSVDKNRPMPAGISAEQPRTLFAQPSTASLLAIQTSWEGVRKPLHLAMVIDTSGSMSGEKIDQAKQAAREFIGQMADNAYLTLIPFSTQPNPVAEYSRVSENSQLLAERTNALEADGDTALYDAIGVAGTLIEKYNRADVANAILILSDGEDTNSRTYKLNQELYDRASANDTTVFTIAYGDNAENDILQKLAEGSNGAFYTGSSADIAGIYQELSAAFGGAGGIGR